MKKAKQGAVPVPKKNLWKQIAKHWEFYVLLLPGIILTIIFKYVPMYGVQIASVITIQLEAFLEVRG